MPKIIGQLTQYCIDNNQGFALYRWPQEQELNFVLGKNSNGISSKFVFAPFEKDQPLIQLEKEVYLQLKALENIPSDFLATYPSSLIQEHPIEDSRLLYDQAFNKYLKQISTGKVDKAILSRVKTVEFNGDYDRVFVRLTKERPAAMVYCFFHPLTGLWMGASPELMAREKSGQCKTTALAGTKAEESLAWGEKEIEEQQIVTRYICDELEKLQLEHKVSDLQTAKAGNVYHLKQLISFQLNEDNFEQVLNTLHPTPAISGLPKKEALSLIQNTEKHARKYYCGYLGELGENSRIYVNLRCAQFFNDQVALYVGGGITADSDLESEWQETENKAMGLESLL